MPTRSNVAKYSGNEEKWDKDIRAFESLEKQGINLQKSDGAADLIERATQPIELEHGTVYGPERAKTIQRVADGEFS